MWPFVSTKHIELWFRGIKHALVSLQHTEISLLIWMSHTGPVEGRGALCIKNNSNHKKGLKPRRTMQRMYNLGRWTKKISCDGCDFCRPQQRITFSSSSDGYTSAQKDDDGWNIPSLCCLVTLAHLFLFSKKGGETEDEKPRDTLCRKAWIRPQGETESKEMEWWRTQQQEEEERCWDVPLHQWVQGGAVQLGCVCFRSPRTGVMVVALKFYVISLYWRHI